MSAAAVDRLLREIAAELEWRRDAGLCGCGELVPPVSGGNGRQIYYSERCRDRAYEARRRHGFRECYDALTARGLAARVRVIDAGRRSARAPHESRQKRSTLP